MPAAVSAESLFFAALDLPPADRAAFLDTACGGDTGLRARIEKMLAAQPDLGEFLDQPAVTPVMTPDQLRELAPRELTGVVIAGKFKLVESIGQGGMGAVWAAEQLHPVRRRVAVKLIRGEYGEAFGLLARFEAERQAIARMDHPHIAKLLDAGTTGESESATLGVGRPYFVMELVDGVPLNEYCDAHRLTVLDRLRLFVHICQAVQHAHQKGVIHRDLKPSNILVEHHSGRPVPRVIDFGLAKATDGVRLTDNTLHTRPGNVAGTPLYMAPEQADTTADVDTRTDVYALGVNLYELLTGTTPIEREQLKKAPLFDILHVIRDSDPPIPSRRLSSSAATPDIAANRQTEPARLGRFVRGDLDWIVMKALAKERDRRYETATAFATDVERFLRHEPVLAGPPTTAYRMSKFIRRHRIQVIAAGVVLLALLAGIGGTTFGLIRAEQRREDAELAQRQEFVQRTAAEKAQAQEAERREEADRERARAERGADRTRTALDSLTQAATGSSFDNMYDTRNEAFLIQVLPYYHSLAAEPAGDESSRARVAGAMARAGAIQHRLRRWKDAETDFDRAIDAYSRLADEFPSVPEYHRELAKTHENLANVLYLLGKPGVSDHTLRGFEIRKKLAADFPALVWCRQMLAEGHYRMGMRHGLSADATTPLKQDEHYRQAIALQKQLTDEFPTVPEYRRELASTHAGIGSMLLWTKLDEAEVHTSQALAIQKKLAADAPKGEEDRKQLAYRYAAMGEVFDLRGRKEAAEEQFRARVAVWVELADSFRGNPEYRSALSSSHEQLGERLVRWGKLREAEEEYRRAVKVQKQLCALLPGNDDYRFKLAYLCDNLGVFAVGRSDTAEAEQRFYEVVALREQLAAQFPNMAGYQIQLSSSYCNLGVIIRDRRRPGESLVWFEKALDMVVAARKAHPELIGTEDTLGTIHRCRAVAYHRLGQPTDAAKEWDRAFELLPKADKRIPAPVVSSLSEANSVPAEEADVAVLSTSGEWSAAQLYSFACVYGRAVGKTAEQKKENANRAMELLGKAVKAGFRDAARIEKDPDFNTLREHDDFKKLLADLRMK